MSRSITLNGVKATVIFHDTTTDNPNDKPTINWELIIESGDNKAMIDGSITMDVRYFEALVQEVEAMPNNTPILTREITGSDFKQYIRKCLSEIASTTSRKEKAHIATTMFNYMTNDGLPFVKEYQEFKKTAIDRAYYLKCKETEFEELMESLDAFLVAIGAPLAIPSEYVESEEDHEEQEDRKYEDRKYEQDEYIDECGYKWHKFVGNLDKNKDNKERIVMLEQLFKKENLTFKIEYMNLYYDWEKTAPRLNRYQKMKAFIHANKQLLMGFEDTENEERKKLMMSIFKKKNLEFKDVYMDMYYEWQKNAPKENRYKKMCSFIEVQGFK